MSHETIYAAIYAQPRGGLKAEMIAALRQHKPARGLRRTTLAGGSIAPESLRIIHRPEEIEARLVPGHWEGDLIKGAFNRSSVGTLVERKTRFVVLCKMNGNGAEAVLDSFTRQMKRLPAALRKSMTYDRGSEMACHPELARRLKIDIWFCDPHAPWQRGSNENTNGLLRQFFPKGTDLSTISQTELNDVARLMNQRPRKTLGWKTPEEAMAEEIAVFKSNVALERFESKKFLATMLKPRHRCGHLRFWHIGIAVYFSGTSSVDWIRNMVKLLDSWAALSQKFHRRVSRHLELSAQRKPNKPQKINNDQ
ncbi:MAG: IS30 family transposase [Cypionkella sp.]|nr:IS30 family transposase [Cypionkella sp.]